MFMDDLNLGITDYAVSRAIMELSKRHEFINASMIAKHINGEETAVYRSIRRMKKAKILKKTGGGPRNGGSKYVYTGK